MPESLLPTMATRAGAAPALERRSPPATCRARSRRAPSKSAMVLMLRKSDSSRPLTSATETLGKMSTMRWRSDARSSSIGREAAGTVDGEQRLAVVARPGGHRHVVASIAPRATAPAASRRGKAISAASANTGRPKCASAVAMPTSGEETGQASRRISTPALVAEIEVLPAAATTATSGKRVAQEVEVAQQERAAVEHEEALVHAGAPAFAAGDQHADLHLGPVEVPRGHRACFRATAAGGGGVILECQQVVARPAAHHEAYRLVTVAPDRALKRAVRTDPLPGTCLLGEAPAIGDRLAQAVGRGRRRGSAPRPAGTGRV